MAAAANVAGQGRNQTDPASGRCPHVIFRNVLGSARAAELLQHVATHQADFRPAIIRNRHSGERRVEPGRRDCQYLGDVGPFKGMIDGFVRGLVPRILSDLQLEETAVEPREFEICAYGDGGHFGAHVDTNELTDRVRVVSCVYYFACTPRAFDGGGLRLHGFPLPSAKGGPGVVDIAPETDSLVAFPSWLRHEVLPVQVPSGRWADGRFTLNCWLLRANGTARGAGRRS